MFILSYMLIYSFISTPVFSSVPNNLNNFQPT